MAMLVPFSTPTMILNYPCVNAQLLLGLRLRTIVLVFPPFKTDSFPGNQSVLKLSFACG